MSKQTKKGIEADAVAIVRSIALTGSLTDGHRAACARINRACVRVDQERAILTAIARLGYVAERHIQESTGITKGLAGIIDDLCDSNQLHRIEVEGYEALYWLKKDGVRRVQTIKLPGIGSLDFANMATKLAIDFARVQVSNPRVMKHLIACADVATRLDSYYTGVVVGERLLRLAEKVLGKFGTFSSGHCPDAVVISPSGDITAAEVECSTHDPREDDVACGALNDSKRIVLALYFAYGRATFLDVTRRVKRTEAADKARVLACEFGQLPRVSRMCPAGVSRKAACSRVGRLGRALGGSLRTRRNVRA